MFAGNFAPQGWMLCQGQILPIAQNEVLFNLIGTTYGGDGQSTFALPDLSGRLPVHQGAGFTLGEMAGAESVTLTPDQLPAHNHSPLANAGAGSADTPAGNVWAAWTGAAYTGDDPTDTMSPAALATAGQNQPHDNMPPFVAINFIISLFGIFPSPG